MSRLPRFTQPDYAEPDLLLMADEALIESAEGATWRLCPLEKLPNPVLELTEPWEGGDGIVSRPVSQDPPVSCVVFDPEEQLYRLWYSTANRALSLCADPALGHAGRALRPEGSGVCHAVSTDGIHWEKRVTGGVIFRNSTNNNLVDVTVPPVQSDHLSSIVANPDPDGPALIGTIYSNFDDPIYPRGITQMYSDDGFAWTPHFPPTLPLDGDAHSLSWDSRRQTYLLTTRSAQHGRIVNRLQRRGYAEMRNLRHIALAQSRDLVHWTPLLDILETDERDDPNAQLYYMSILPYGHAYLGLVQVFLMEPEMTHGTLEMQLAISRDLENWSRVGDKWGAKRGAILPMGEPGSWDSRHVTLGTNPPFPEGDRLRFWYGGKDADHWQAGHAALGTATLRRDGWACWEAGSQGGTVTTVPLELNWATWPMLNFHAPDGEVRLEILNEAGHPLPGFGFDNCIPLSGDHNRAVVNFHSNGVNHNFIRHTGPVRLRIHLRNAQLFAAKVPNVRF